VPDIKNPSIQGGFLRGEKKEIWMHLCEQAAVEQNPDKLMDLIKQINRLLEEKERRLKSNSNNSDDDSDKAPTEVNC
jgi:hypothetical protein